MLLLNPDVRCEPGSIDALVRFMDAHPEAGAAGPKLLNLDGSLQWSCRMFSTPLLFALRGLGLEHRLELGAALIARREAIAEVGGMDEGYFLYCEDQDWCYRMWTRGWTVYYVPDSVMMHAHRRASSGGRFGRYKWIHMASTLRMFSKQGPSGRRPVPTSSHVAPAERSA